MNLKTLLFVCLQGFQVVQQALIRGDRRRMKQEISMGKRKNPPNRKTTFMSTKRLIPAAAGFAFFVFISYFIVTRDTMVFDSVICEYLYGLRNETLNVFFTAVTYLGNWQTITLLCCLFLLIPRTRISFGIPVSAAAILASLIQRALKVSFHRARPDLALHLVNQGGYSFPSGHSFTVLIVYGMIIFLCRRNIQNKTAANLITVLLSCLIPLIGFSRIYLGVHYPTDVLGGWSLGLCVLMILISGVYYFQKEIIKPSHKRHKK
jgi:undecaprenyl-diphosphatase